MNNWKEALVKELLIGERNKGLVRELLEVKDCLSAKKTTTVHRRHPAEEDEDLLVPGIDPFLVDSELKIAQSRAVRRMLDKTQVVTNPNNLHIRKRITHAGEVTAIASFTSAILGLNHELAKAIALAHDIGHPPFGYDGEAFLRKASGKKFLHEVFGVVIAQHIERCGKGLNLTREVLFGIIRDAWPTPSQVVPLSEEAKVVMWADRFAYVTGDFNDLARIGYPTPMKLVDLMVCLGANQRERVNNLITALCFESAAKGEVSFGDTEDAASFLSAKTMMYEIYPVLNASNAPMILERIAEFVQKIFPDVDTTLILALMTDHDALYLASQPVLDYSSFQQVTVAEMIPLLREKEIRWWEPDLEW